MPRLAAPLLLSALLSTLPPLAGAARAVDLTQARCADFLQFGEADRNQFSLWLGGYYAGLSQRPELDLEKVVAAPARLAELCAKAPQTALVGPETRAVFQPTP